MKLKYLSFVGIAVGFLLIMNMGFAQQLPVRASNMSLFDFYLTSVPTSNNLCPPLPNGWKKIESGVVNETYLFSFQLKSQVNLCLGFFDNIFPESYTWTTYPILVRPFDTVAFQYDQEEESYAFFHI